MSEEATSPHQEEAPQSNEPGIGGVAADDIDTNWDEALESFDQMELPEELLRGIYAYGFEKPSAIQQRAIKPTMLGRDLIAQAQSGTGKTATFAIGTLAKLDLKLRECQSLIP